MNGETRRRTFFAFNFGFIIIMFGDFKIFADLCCILNDIAHYFEHGFRYIESLLSCVLDQNNNKAFIKERLLLQRSYYIITYFK